MGTALHVLPYLMLMAAGFGSLVLIGWLLSRLRGHDGPLTPLDRGTVRNHLWSRWF